MSEVTISRELRPCPFCGSEAQSDNGFAPCESITYAWCSNRDCPLHPIDTFGFTPESWNTRAALEAPQQDGQTYMGEPLIQHYEAPREKINALFKALDFHGAVPVGDILDAALARIEAPVRQHEPVGEEVEVVGYASTAVPEDTPLMTVEQHQRLLEEAKQGQRVLSHELEQLKGQLKFRESLVDAADTLLADNNTLKSEVERLNWLRSIDIGVVAGLRAENAKLRGALNQIAQLEGSEVNEWGAVDRLIPEFSRIARAALAATQEKPE
jgi:hypothetical protein